MIYNKLRNSNIDGGIDITFPHKKTSKLFEIYSFLIIKDIFEELGFNWSDGWLRARDIKDVFNASLESGDCIILTKLDYSVVITYDKYLNTPSEVSNSEDSQIVASQVSSNRRPDILISLYKGEELRGCEVVEVKYRKKSYIYNNKGIDTDVCKQLIAYTQLEYYDANIKKVSRIKPVYKVLTIFPKQDDEGVFAHKNYDILFVPIMPEEELNSKCYGYEYLKKELIEFIDEFSY
ncbi:hypothetical protein [Faecalimicrobium dakarense]|uniref:hypothetical protein n=1 Tax=Faecalimicrobium dakarense TaxID=1301100 RepID=UPI0005AB75B8|nr:hypothetical protein [[Clostridium] dakarense]